MYYSPVFSLLFIRPTEYGFLFSFGKSVFEHPDAQLIMFIQRIMLKNQTPSAIQNQSIFQPKTKCIASKIHAGIVHSKLINILKSRQAKKLPILFMNQSPFIKSYAQGSADFGLRMSGSKNCSHKSHCPSPFILNCTSLGVSAPPLFIRSFIYPLFASE